MATPLVGNFTTNNDRTRQTTSGASPDRGDHDPHAFDPSFSHDGGPVIDESDQVDRQVLKLAREYSNASNSAAAAHVFDPSHQGSQIDPESDDFNSRAWTKAMLRLHKQSGQENVGRTAGFAFRNLSAYGYSKGSDFQKTVDNYILAGADLLRSLTGNKGQRVDILRNFEGLVNQGEMLVVLGPPGSGCSTFLKTIAGETHGFNLGDESYINYQGMTSSPHISRAGLD